MHAANRSLRGSTNSLGAERPELDDVPAEEHASEIIASSTSMNTPENVTAARYPDRARQSAPQLERNPPGEAGLGATRFHDLRHACVTLLLDLGVPPPWSGRSSDIQQSRSR